MDEGCAYGLTRDGCGAALGPGTEGGASVSLFLSVFFPFCLLRLYHPGIPGSPVGGEGSANLSMYSS